MFPYTYGQQGSTGQHFSGLDSYSARMFFASPSIRAVGGHKGRLQGLIQRKYPGTRLVQVIENDRMARRERVLLRNGQVLGRVRFLTSSVTGAHIHLLD